MNEYNCKSCLPTTHLDVIKSIIDWVTDESTGWKSVLWLHGLAGSRKSTLLTIITWMMRDIQQQGTFFFFNRDVLMRNAAMLIRMLAYHFVLFDARFGDAISWSVRV